MGKFITTGQLDVMDSESRKALSPAVREIQRIIMSSSATTVTTNIADINHLTKTARAYLETEEGLRGVSLRVDEPGMEGILQYNRSEAKFQMTNAGQSYDVPENVGQRLIREAISGDSSKIRDLGINYTQNHQMDEISNLMVAAGKKADALEKTSVLNSLGKTYSTLSGSISFGDAIKISRGQLPSASTFGIGAENYPDINQYNQAMAQLARSRAAMGNPYYALDAKSLKVSTIMAESSGDYSKNILDKLNNMVQSGKYAGEDLEKLRAQIDSLKYVDYNDILSEIGVSHFMGEKNLRVMSQDGVLRNKLFIPLEIMQKAAGDEFAKGRISLSYAATAEGKSYMNAVYNATEGTTKEQARTLAENIYNLVKEKSESISVSKLADDEASSFVRSALGMVQGFGDGEKKEKLLDELAEKIMSRNVVIGSIEGEGAERAVRSLIKAGYDISNDMLASLGSARILDVLGFGEGLRIGPLIDDLARIGSRLQEGDGETIKYLNHLATFIKDNNMEGQIRRQVSRARLGMEPNKIADFYLRNKTKIGIGGLGLLAAGSAYYISKKYRENQIYDETIQAQPTERFSRSQGLSDQMDLQASISSFRRDPLATAGIVGNLDRNKIGHYRMGNDKYNHLYAGV